MPTQQSIILAAEPGLLRNALRWHRLAITISHATAAELADAFERAYVRWRRVGRLDDPAGWVRRVAINRAIDQHQIKRRFGLWRVGQANPQSRPPGALWQIGASVLMHSGDLAFSDLLWELSDLLPSGLYDGNSLERYIRRVLEMPGRHNRFDFLEQQLFIVATELDSGNRAVFGQGGKGVVPISRAVAASSAIPILYLSLIHISEPTRPY